MTPQSNESHIAQGSGTPLTVLLYHDTSKSFFNNNIVVSAIVKMKIVLNIDNESVIAKSKLSDVALLDGI